MAWVRALCVLPALWELVGARGWQPAADRLKAFRRDFGRCAPLSSRCMSLLCILGLFGDRRAFFVQPSSLFITGASDFHIQLLPIIG
jgi:hypothetical protein